MDQTNQMPAENVQDVNPENEIVILTPEQVIDNAVKSFSATEATDAKIAAWKAEAEAMTISGVDDKVGYTAVKTERIRIKNLRLAVSDKEKELLQLPKDFTTAVKAEAARLIKDLKAIEDNLQTKQTAIDDVVTAQKKKAKEAAEAEARKITFRENSLYDLGATRDREGRFLIGEWAVTPDQIKTTEENEFSLLLKGIEQTLPKTEPAQTPAPSTPLPVETPQQHTPAAPAPTSSISIPGNRTRPANVAAPAFPTTAAQPEQPQPTQTVNIQFAAGFEAAKREIIQILQSPDKMTRAELVEKINNLKP